MLTQNLPSYWESKYNKDEDGWDLGKSTPALQDFFKHELCPKEGRVLVPGAGRGYDAKAWAEKGHETLAVDFCPTAVDALENLSRTEDNLESLDHDIFELQPKEHGSFDVIYEYTCFSAIHPGRRDEYFEVWYRMLKDDGRIFAFFYPLCNDSTMQGPPHPTSEGELLARMDDIFEVEHKIKIENSAEGREGKEEIWVLKKVL
jgi:cyclopropane fatty-acyl-phospholipid synthase-like methyltransferase